MLKTPERVIATGSSFKGDMPFKNLSSTETTKKALHDWAKRIESAKSIVVAGAGATGIELAGELGQEYAVTGKKEVTLICDQDLPLGDKYKRDVRETAKKELERLKVKVITNAKAAISSSPNTITLSSTKNGTSTLQADLLIPTYGVTPNTSFLPPAMLDARGFVKQTTYLRAEGHDDIFVVGDAGNLQDAQGVHTDGQVVHVVKLIEGRLLASAAPAAEYKPDGKVMFAATLGKSRGVGQMGGLKLWSWVVWFAKGRYLGTDYAPDFVKGMRTLTAKGW
jgi:NADH dehydrogenase FAD-containing subunit